MRRSAAVRRSGSPARRSRSISAKVHDHRPLGGRGGRRERVSAERLDALGVTRHPRPRARFVDRRTVVAGEATIRARTFVIATGAVPAPPSYEGLDAIEALDVAAALDVSRKPSPPHRARRRRPRPRTGAGLQPARHRCERHRQPTTRSPARIPELVAPLLDRLRAEGIRVRDNADHRRLRPAEGRRPRHRPRGRGGGRRRRLAPARRSRPRRPNVEGLGLDAAGIDHDPSGIVVDRHLRTTNKRVYAIGDAVAGASLGEPRRTSCHPWCSARSPAAGPPATPRAACRSWSSPIPELARVGLSEAEARARAQARPRAPRPLRRERPVAGRADHRGPDQGDRHRPRPHPRRRRRPGAAPARSSRCGRSRSRAGSASTRSSRSRRPIRAAPTSPGASRSPSTAPARRRSGGPAALLFPPEIRLTAWTTGRPSSRPGLTAADRRAGPPRPRPVVEAPDPHRRLRHGQRGADLCAAHRQLPR